MRPECGGRMHALALAHLRVVAYRMSGSVKDMQRLPELLALLGAQEQGGATAARLQLSLLLAFVGHLAGVGLGGVGLHRPGVDTFAFRDTRLDGVDLTAYTLIGQWNWSTVKTFPIGESVNLEPSFWVELLS